jgi:hypothetical protein
MTVLAYSSVLGLATHMTAVFAMLILRKVSICAKILKTSLPEKGMPLHLKLDYLSDGNLAFVRLKK